MQHHEEEAHLSVQQPEATDINSVTQNIIWLSQENNKIHVTSRQSSTITNLDHSEYDKFIIHFRVSMLL